MNTTKQMIIIKGEIKTPQIRYCQYNANTKKMDVEFTNGKKYPYAYYNVEWLKEPKVLNPNMVRINKEGCDFTNIDAIYVFTGKLDTYLHICFRDGRESDYRKKDLRITESCLCSSKAAKVFEYIKQVATLSNLKNEVTGEKMLEKKFKIMSFIGNDIVLAKYLEPSSLQSSRIGQYIPIFPFGCNNSQYKAVKNALENQISVIQGPPGTGKTQTILNIIANILIQGKTVQVVSNNNSATDNVYDKLSSPEYKLDFVAAKLGCSDNKKKFISEQEAIYPDFSSWKMARDQGDIRKSVIDKSMQLKNLFDKKEKLAYLKQEEYQLKTEFKYFIEYLEETDVNIDILGIKKNIPSKKLMLIWQECQMISEKRQKLGFVFKMKLFFCCGVLGNDFYKQNITKIISSFQYMYYCVRLDEIRKEIGAIEHVICDNDEKLPNELCDLSMKILKDSLARKYELRGTRKIFNEDNLWKSPNEVLGEYPVILSTTFSSRNSLNTSVIYDYLIIDEASQVDIATGALALSCARNAVIVGDTKQLPNVVNNEDKVKAKSIFDSFNINEGYQFTRSFLQSVLDVIPNVAQTLLREHYRCHPKIINFCNQKFYRGELVVMTIDKGENDVLTAVRTVKGNHVRDHYSQRQIDVIRKEIIPNYVTNKNETGIIAPYRNQVKELRKEITDIEIATVHKFQGKEKDTIIISTVDDEISDFADDPYLINVAVSRAKKKLVLVVTGNEQTKERNITDLIDYIRYNNFEVKDSKIYSIFDYLYKQYSNERKAYLQKYKKVSDFDSERLIYSLVEEILAKDKYASYDVVCHFPMNMLIKNLVLLNEQECRYAMNPATHVDFLIFNRISKKPVLAIEVDGYEYHKEGTIQASRDLLKNHIMDLYEIPLLRLRTNESDVKKKMVEELDKLIGK